MRPSPEEFVNYFGVYLHLYQRFQFHPWRTRKGIDAAKPLSEAEIRESLYDFGEYVYGWLSINGQPFSDADYLFFYQELVKKVMGPTKKTW